MRETKFIEQNREKWAEFEAMLRDYHRDPDKLNDLFIQITDDLSYARTFYPNRSVRMYLNSLAQRIFHNIYRGKRFPAARFRLFWTEELPRLIWESRLAMLLAFSLFALAALIGVVSSMANPDFARIILGDQYVEMTLQNIQNGDPMAVYKESQPLGMSVGIAANNLFVALRTAIFGVLASIGTVFMLLYNGIMLGAFQYFFVEKGLFWQSFLTIWIHGTLEISAIIIAGAAGLVAGSGLLFPGTYTRVQAFQLTMRRGLKIFIGLIPMFLLAAFFEGFFTRFTETPAPVRGLFILISLAFVLWYFVWLPWHRAQQPLETVIPEKELPPTRAEAVRFSAIKNAGEVFSDVFTLIRHQPRPVWLGVGAASALWVALAVFLNGRPVTEAFLFPDYPTGAFDGWLSGLDLVQNPVLCYAQVLLCWGLALLGYYAVKSEMPPDMRAIWKTGFAGWHQFILLFVSALTVGFLASVKSGFSIWLLGVAGLGLTGLWMAVAYYENSTLRSFLRASQMIRRNQGGVLGFLVVNLALLLFLFLDSGVWDIMLQFFSWLIPPDSEKMQFFMTVTTLFAASFIAQLSWLVLVLSGAILYFSCREITDAASLRAGIDQVGKARQIRGLARE